ncbi:YegS/Rv2252/BmrU family lipid kinase [Bacillus lacus]|uniref:YegS/Rv2252/BmrU family lipid kinase n=1 Tax=Metabacillus lacus TaxID=1983721 RepID=A0A7X2J0W8_9BACI|nr:diacylglycerol kinase family protein [Metabacillus lacus]MRX72703.1 YegS/Rv2252/BmrU family lipid kinase [Metabacillus lacus]
MKDLVFIINPAAGNGRGAGTWRKVKKILDRDGVQYRSFQTEYQGHAEILARQIASLGNHRLQSITGIGGDGTIHEIINGLSEYEHIHVGYIPAGSGNDIARGFKTSKKPAKALKNILKQHNKGKCRVFDGGRLSLDHFGNHRLFLNSAGIGLDAAVTAAASQLPFKNMLNKANLGYLSYAAALLHTLQSFQPCNMEAVIDGNSFQFEKVWLIAVANQPYYGGGMKIAPQAVPTDGLLHITVVKEIPKWKLLLLFVTVFTGKHTLLKEVEILTCKEIFLRSEVPLPVQADGEIAGETPVIVSVLASRMNLLT